MKVTEIKRWLDGRQERFVCEALRITDQVAVLRFLVPPESNYVVHDAAISPGSATLAVFWEGANYLVYKMIDSSGALIGYRFDVCKDVDITLDKVKWTDLVLDAWVATTSSIVFLDEDEVVELRVSGLISDKDYKIIEKTKEFLFNNYLQVIADTEKELKRTCARDCRS